MESQLCQYHIKLPITKKVHGIALAGVTQWIEHLTAKQRVAGSIPSQGTFSHPSPLSKNK